jgi:hypothetical protein
LYDHARDVLLTAVNELKKGLQSKPENRQAKLAGIRMNTQPPRAIMVMNG